MVLIGRMSATHRARRWATLGAARPPVHGRRGRAARRCAPTAGRQRRWRSCGGSRTTYRTTTMATLRVAFLSALVLELLATISVALVAVGVGLRLDAGGMTLEVGLFALILAPEAYLPLRRLGAEFHATEEGAVGGAARLRDHRRARPARGRGGGARPSRPAPSRPLGVEWRRVGRAAGARPRGAGRRVAGRAPRRGGGGHGVQRCRQEHAPGGDPGAAGAVGRAGAGHRRRRDPRTDVRDLDADGLARLRRVGAAGAVPVRRDGGRERAARAPPTPRRRRGGGPGGGGPRRRVPVHRPRASVGSGSRAASGGGWASRGRSCAGRPSSSSTSRRQAWTRSPRQRSWRPSAPRPTRGATVLLVAHRPGAVAGCGPDGRGPVGGASRRRTSEAGAGSAAGPWRRRSPRERPPRRPPDRSAGPRPRCCSRCSRASVPRVPRSASRRRRRG